MVLLMIPQNASPARPFGKSAEHRISCKAPIRSGFVSFIPLFDGSLYPATTPKSRFMATKLSPKASFSNDIVNPFGMPDMSTSMDEA
jgi:hypothetical protein